MNQVFIQVGRETTRHDPTPIENVERIAYVPYEIQVLLDQNNRHAPLTSKHRKNRANLLDNIRLNSLGWFIQEEHLGLAYQRPCNGKLLLLPTGKIPPHPAPHLLQYRKEVVYLPGNITGTLLRLEPHAKVLYNGDSRKYLPPLGHKADPAASPRIRRERSQIAIIDSYATR